MNKLFEDVADKDIRANNRAATMVNLYQEFGDGGKNTTPLGLAKIMRYFKRIPATDKPLTLEYFKAMLKNRGLKAL